MSEYQYYEFLAIDRRLTAREMAELRAISSRADITPTRFANEYNWGDLKADAGKLLERYFDVHVYVANWGTRRVALRMSAARVDANAIGSYCISDQTSLRKAGGFVIVDLWSELEDPEDWEDGSGWMASLAPIRTEILGGDLRPLYLAWLASAQDGQLDDDDVEPQVPPGLGDLSAPQTELAGFLRLDPHLVAVATEGSSTEVSAPPGFPEWLAALPAGEKDGHLLDIVQGKESRARTALLERFRRQTSKKTGVRQPRNEGRTVRAILDAAAARREEHEEAAARRAEEEARRRREADRVARSKYLVGVSKRSDSIWSEVEALICTLTPRAYDQAVVLLRDLRDAGKQAGRPDGFAARVAVLRERHARKPSLLARLQAAGLLKG